MKNKNVLVLVIVAVLIAAVGAAGFFATRGPQGGQAPQQQAKAYLRVQVGYEVWPLMPLADGGVYTVEQGDGRVNVIHTTQDSIWMHSSTCENQDCVDQGVVSLENRDTRVLSNLVVCLPNEVLLELLTPEEAGALEGQ